MSNKTHRSKTDPDARLARKTSLRWSVLNCEFLHSLAPHETIEAYLYTGIYAKENKRVIIPFRAGRILYPKTSFRFDIQK